MVLRGLDSAEFFGGHVLVAFQKSLEPFPSPVVLILDKSIESFQFDGGRVPSFPGSVGGTSFPSVLTTR